MVLESCAVQVAPPSVVARIVPTPPLAPSNPTAQACSAVGGCDRVQLAARLRVLRRPGGAAVGGREDACRRRHLPTRAARRRRRRLPNRAGDRRTRRPSGRCPAASPARPRTRLPFFVARMTPRPTAQAFLAPAVATAFRLAVVPEAWRRQVAPPFLVARIVPDVAYHEAVVSSRRTRCRRELDRCPSAARSRWRGAASAVDAATRASRASARTARGRRWRRAGGREQTGTMAPPSKRHIATRTTPTDQPTLPRNPRSLEHCMSPGGVMAAQTSSDGFGAGRNDVLRSGSRKGMAERHVRRGVTAPRERWCGARCLQEESRRGSDLE